jgi:hypothetical protein
MTEAAGEGAGNKVGHVSGYAGLLQLDGGVDVAHKPPCAEEANEAEHQENGEGTHEVVAKVEGRLPMAQMKGGKRGRCRTQTKTQTKIPPPNPILHVGIPCALVKLME